MTPTPEPTPDEWIPTDAEARNRSGLLLDRYDAWLAAHDAQVAEKAWDEAASAFAKVGTVPGPPNPPTNPYRRTYA